MSFVTATPELVQGAAQDVAGIGSSLAQASSAAAGPTTGVVAAGHRARHIRLMLGTPELISECHRLFRYPYEFLARI
jgi:PE family